MTARAAAVSLGMCLCSAALLGCTGTATSTSGQPAGFETAAPTSLAPPPAASPEPVPTPTPTPGDPATPPIVTSGRDAASPTPPIVTSPAAEPSAPSTAATSSPGPGARTCTGITGCGERELCQGPEGCGVAWTCGPMRACTRDLAEFCGCNGVTFRSSSKCPSQPYKHRGACAGGTRGGAKP